MKEHGEEEMVRMICDDNRLTWDRESESQCDTAGSGQVDRDLRMFAHEFAYSLGLDCRVATSRLTSYLIVYV